MKNGMRVATEIEYGVKVGIAPSWSAAPAHGLWGTRTWPGTPLFGLKKATIMTKNGLTPSARLTTGYGYDPNAAVGQRLFITFFTAFGRYLIDPHESMSYATQSLTKTAGGDGRTAGSISSSVSLDTWNFGDQHSAEWERDIQETAPFYSELMFRLHIITP
ncbi:hypothetical protein GALL_346430 [mine drainage metagenome]|uniref:Uncharacterized protein n=1 Tax=mine drainage metagenome TaxID=410659 RepID=A0A1J5QJ94_9ZZZZ